MREWSSYPSHTWPDVVASFRRTAEANPYFAPMRDFVERLAVSPYAAALHPTRSMHTVILSQHPRAHAYHDRVQVAFDAGEFVIEYRGGPTAATWTKRGPDGLAVLERFFHHVRWFVEYGPDDVPAARSASRPAI